MVTLSHKELQRVRVIEKVADGRLSVSEAAGLLECSSRQVQRLKRNYQPDSADWVQHRNRGRIMPWRLDPALRQRVVELAKGKYAGFNDSHLHQKLVECEGLHLSRESVRRILRGAKLRSPQKRRPHQYRSRRLRRTRRGTMLLTDASRHDWLEARGPRLTLIGFQDDATGEIMAAHFQLEPENAVGYLRCFEQLVTTHGIPFSVYRHRHGIFQRNDPHWTLEEELLGQQFPTQVGRAFAELGVQQIAAHSPQAKGRIERLWRTLQDRLLAELRLASACSLNDANRVLAAFCADHNRRYAVPALESGSDFRPLPRGFDLARCLCFRYPRRVAPDHTIRYRGHILPLPPAPKPRAYAGTTVELSHQLDGILRVYRDDLLLVEFPRPLAELAQPARPPQRRRSQPPLPLSYNPQSSSGPSASAPKTSFRRHSLVAANAT